MTATFDDAVRFHGHACPGLAMGYRVAVTAMEQLADGRSRDEGLVAIVENNSCAVDAVQLVCGCTFGKGNLLFKDYGKQVYTFIRRPRDKAGSVRPGAALRLAVHWQGPEESAEETVAWQRYIDGDRSPAVTAVVQRRKTRKMEAILAADAAALFAVRRLVMEPPPPARIYPTRRCARCGENVMAARLVQDPRGELCIPCADKGETA